MRLFSEQVLKDLFDRPHVFAVGSTAVVRRLTTAEGDFAVRELNAVRLGSLQQYVKWMLMALNGIGLARRAGLVELGVTTSHRLTYLSRANGIGLSELTMDEIADLQKKLRLFDPESQKNLNDFFDFLINSNRALLIADFVDGQGLIQYLSDLYLFDEYIDVYHQIKAILLALNESGLMHLDMHPRNLIFDFRQRYLKLLDLDSLSSRPHTILPPLDRDYVCNTNTWDFTVEQQNVFLLIKYYNDLMLQFAQNFGEGINMRQLMYSCKGNLNKPFEQVCLEIDDLIDKIRTSLPREVILVSN